MSPVRIATFLGAVTLTVVLSACGGGSSSSSGGGSGSGGSSGAGKQITCDSISKAQAEQILGGTIEPPSPASAPSTGCSWTVASTELRAPSIIALNTQTFVFEGTLKAQNTPEVADNYTIEKVSGLGDDAYFQSPKNVAEGALGSETLLLVKNGNIAYNISVSKKGATEAQIKDLEKQVAQAILAKS